MKITEKGYWMDPIEKHLLRFAQKYRMKSAFSFAPPMPLATFNLILCRARAPKVSSGVTHDETQNALCPAFSVALSHQRTDQNTFARDISVGRGQRCLHPVPQLHVSGRRRAYELSIRFKH